jgi:Tol biopolymer transport system component
MGRWGWLAAACVGAALALLVVHCGGGDSASDDPDLLLPDRGEPDAALSDAGASDGSAFDARLGCDLSKPFGTPFPLAELPPTFARSTPRLSPDELAIYFTSNGADAGSDLSVAVRSSPSAAFGSEAILPQSTMSNENDPSVSADQLSLFFHSNRSGSSDIFVATRTSTSTPFGVAVPVAPPDQPTTNENHAYFRSAGSELWFISDRDGGAGGFDIYVAKRSGTAFAAPTRVAELSSPAQDWQPQPSEDGLTILFASDRDGGAGKMDLWIARRADAAAPFGMPTPLTELNSPNVDQAGWLSADGCRIWFSSGRGNGDTRQQIFHAERPQ